MSDLRLKVSSNPHVRSAVTTSQIMAAVVIALLPAAGFGIYNFGIWALIHILICVATTVATEFLYELLLKNPITVGDLSAVVTGLLLAYNIPATAPWWIPVVGGVFAILIVKQLLFKKDHADLIACHLISLYQIFVQAFCKSGIS